MSTSPNCEDALRAGAASVDITPAAGCSMQGYGSRWAEAIADPLQASALAIGCRGVDWLLLSVDCIGLDRDFVARVRGSLAKSLAVSTTAITINCSHTHSGPATIARLGPVEADRTYLDFLADQLLHVGNAAAHAMRSVRWRLGSVELAENINRRLTKRGRVELGADPRGPVDNRLCVLRLDDAASSAPVAFIVHYACHPTVSSGTPHISADWPGRMRSTLQSAYGGNSLVVCFLQGCAGDITHRIARDPRSWASHFGHHTAVQADILGRLCGAAAITASEHAVPVRAEAVQVSTNGLSLRYLDAPGEELTEVQVIRVGAADDASVDESVWIVALPGEPFAEYGMDISARIHRQIGTHPNNVLVCGYSNDAVGYLCTPRALGEGGYEAAQAHHVYNRPAPFAASAQADAGIAVSDGARVLMNARRGRFWPYSVGALRKRLSEMLS